VAVLQGLASGADEKIIRRNLRPSPNRPEEAPRANDSLMKAAGTKRRIEHEAMG